MSQSKPKGIVRDAPGDPAQPKETGQRASAKTKAAAADRELSDAELDAVAVGASEDNGYGRSRG
jgi:hypothetical protein